MLSASVLGNVRRRSLSLYNRAVYAEAGGSINSDGYGYQPQRVPNLSGMTGAQILKTLLPMRPCGGTDTGLALRTLRQERKVYDTILLVTDEQENGRIGAYNEWLMYRRDVAPNARLVIVNVSANKWHIAPGIDSSITHIQTVNASIYKSLTSVEDDVVDVIERVELPSIRAQAEADNLALLND